MHIKSALASLAVLSTLAQTGVAQPAAAGNDPSSAHLFPTYHLRPPKNWINDPCGPYYDEATKEYHMFYQYNPYDVEWGNITWGHFSSRDLATWTALDTALTPGPSPYDKHHVFSGSTLAKGYKGFPTIYYTGVNHTPIGWRQPFIRGSENQAMAYTTDHGQTWVKASATTTPLLGGEDAPGGNLTGWRDPFVFTSSAIDRAIKKEGNGTQTHYMIVSGGKQENAQQPDFGPSLFLYKSEDFVTWTPAATEPAFLHFAGNATFKNLPADRAGSFGYNFELTNFNSLTDDWGHEWNFVVAGTEGGRSIFDLHWPMWLAGDITTHDHKNGSTPAPKFEPRYAGVGDWGTYYAQNGFTDPVSNTWVVWGWSNEDDGAAPHTARQKRGWAGMLTVPREQFIKTIEGVSERVAKQWESETGMWKAQQDPTDATRWRLATLGVRPAAAVGKLRGEVLYTATNQTLHHGAVFNSTDTPVMTTVADIRLRFRTLPSGSQKAGLTLFKHASNSEFTHIYYDSTTRHVIADRTHSSLLAGAGNSVMRGALDLVPGEELEMRLLVDGSIVEVFVNDRFAMTVRVYPTQADAAQLAWFVEGGDQVTADVEVVAVKSAHANATIATPVTSSARALEGGMVGAAARFVASAFV